MVKEGYKETELGVIPQDWGVFAVADIIDVLTDFTANGSFASLADNVTYHEYPDYARLVRLTDIRANFKNEGIYVSKSSYDFLKKSSLFGGELLLANVGAYAGYSFLFKKNFTSYATLGPNMFLIKTNKNILSEAYTALVFGYGTVFKQLIDKAASSAQPKINKANVRECLAIIPPLVEQEKIAETVSDMDNLISSLEKLIEKKKAVKQGAMQELLTGKKRLPGFSGEWCDIKLGDCCEIYDGTHQTPNYTEYGMPFYSVENVTADDFANTKYISFEEHELLNKNRRMEKGDVLMTRIGSIGDCKYIDWDVNASFYVSLALIKCKKKISGQFLSYYSHTEKFKKEIEIRSLLTAIPQKINLGPISEIVINVPTDINEQNAITEIILDMDNEIKKLEQKLAKCQKLKQGMMQQLLTGKIRLVSNNDTVENKPEVDTLKVSSKGHNHQFDDAVVIAGIVDKFYSDKYPLGRKKVQKLLYLFRRHQEADTSAFKKKAAGPYADEVRYKGGEPIAVSNEYISVKKGSKGFSFSKGKKIASALTYLENWNLNDDIKWLCEQFKYIKTDKLELLATVDMAICDLTDAGITVTVDSIKNLIKSHSEWKAKLSKSYFKDNDIAWAIKECKRLFN